MEKYYIYLNGKKYGEIPKNYNINRDVHITHNFLTEFIGNLFKDNAYIVGNKIFIRNKPNTEINRNPTLKHELKHIEQQGEDRFFILKYLMENIKKGYRENKYEKEAYESSWAQEPYESYTKKTLEQNNKNNTQQNLLDRALNKIRQTLE